MSMVDLPVTELEEGGNGFNSCSGRGGCLGSGGPIGDLLAAAAAATKLRDLKRELSKSSPDHLTGTEKPVSGNTAALCS